MSFGVITIVEGSFYARLALDLARSLALHSPDVPTAVVASKNLRSQLADAFDHFIPIDEQKGKVAGFEQKLFVDCYSPFEETLYLDCDSLVYRSLRFIPEFYSNQTIGYVGKKVRSGEYYSVPVQRYCELFNLPYMIQAQGGFLFFRREKRASEFFKLARNIHPQLKDAGVPAWTWRGRDVVSDEPALGIALATLRIEPCQDFGKTMRYPMGLLGRPRFDVLRSICRLQLSETDYAVASERCEPAVMHFCTWHNHRIYTRERFKLRLHESFPRLDFLISALGPAIELADIVQNFIKRVPSRAASQLGGVSQEIAP